MVLTSDQTKLEDEFILTQVTTNHLTSFELYMKEHEHLNLDGNHGFTMKKRFFCVDFVTVNVEMYFKRNQIRQPKGIQIRLGAQNQTSSKN